MLRWWAKNSWWFITFGGFSIMFGAIFLGIKILDKNILIPIMIIYGVIVISAYWAEYYYYEHKPFLWWRKKK